MSSKNSAPDAAQFQQRIAAMAMPFLANTVQDDPRVACTARTFAGTLFVTRDGQLVHGQQRTSARQIVGARLLWR